MIAKNYIRFPEALRFQCEMFSNGYHNNPRIMRLMTVIFDWKVETPQWLKDAQARAKALVKIWKKAMIAFNFAKNTKPELNKINTITTPTKAAEQPRDFRFLPVLHPFSHQPNEMKASGNYRNFCRRCNRWAVFTTPFQYANTQQE